MSDVEIVVAVALVINLADSLEWTKYYVSSQQDIHEIKVVKICNGDACKTWKTGDNAVKVIKLPAQKDAKRDESKRKC